MEIRHLLFENFGEKLLRREWQKAGFRFTTIS